MPSSLFNCVKSADVTLVGKAAAAYKKMSQATVPSACKAGDLLLDRMKKLGHGEASIAPYRYLVIDRFHVFSNEANVYVGLPESISNPQQAAVDKMHEIYALKDVAFDLAKQSGEVETAFHAAMEKAGTG